MYYCIYGCGALWGRIALQNLNKKKIETNNVIYNFNSKFIIYLQKKIRKKKHF